MSRQGGVEEAEEVGGGAEAEPQVIGHQPRSSELITPSISLSDPARGGKAG